MVAALAYAVCTALWGWQEAVDDGAGVHEGRFDVEAIVVGGYLCFLLPVVDGRKEELFEPHGGFLVGVLEDAKGFDDVLSADVVHDEAHFAR